jgi:hypothetical protein
MLFFKKALFEGSGPYLFNFKKKMNFPVLMAEIPQHRKFREISIQIRNVVIECVPKDLCPAPCELGRFGLGFPGTDP